MFRQEQDGPICTVELPAILNREYRIFLGFALVLSVIYYGLSRTWLSWIVPGYLELYYSPKKYTAQHQSGSTVYRHLTRCTETSHTDWTYAAVNADQGDKLLDVFFDFLGIKLLLQKFDTNLAISNTHISNYLSIPLRVRDRGVL